MSGSDIHSSALSRRGLIGLAGAGAVGLLIAGLPQRADAHQPLVQYSEIWNQPTYTDSGGAFSFWYNPTFYSLLEQWLEFYWGHTPVNWTTPMRVWSNGVHGDKAGSCGGGSVSKTQSCHSFGRAMDFARLYMTVSGSLAQTVNVVYNTHNGQTGWKYYTGTALTTARNRYWAFVASLNYHFADVLHYWFTPTYFSDAKDYSHEWHVHADNGVSGSGYSRFAPSTSVRKVQVFTVQSCLRYIWGQTPTMDGVWGPETERLSDAILANMGRSGHLTSSQANWQAFLRAATLWGTGAQTSWGGGGGCLTGLTGGELKAANAHAAAIPC
jgi:hypothetical protein